MIRYFNGTTIFELYVLLTAYVVFLTRADLYLNDSELKIPLLTFKSTLLAGGSSLLDCHKLPDVSSYILSLYSIKLYMDIAM